jgi:hypothetical protein
VDTNAEPAASALQLAAHAAQAALEQQRAAQVGNGDAGNNDAALGAVVASAPAASTVAGTTGLGA